jgi:predicted nucleic acid-binding protein
LDALFEFPLHVIDKATIHHALSIKERYGVSYWDAAVIASANALGCAVIYTEDLNDGQTYEGVRALNPFK